MTSPKPPQRSASTSSSGAPAFTSGAPAFAALSDAELTDEITTWAGRIAAAEARLLALIAELDRREAWAGPGLLSCAHWISWRLGMGLAAARERVRAARALASLPELADAYATGRVSWTQVRAITRVATAEDEGRWVEWAQHATGAQLERLVRGVRRARKPEEDAVDPELAAWRVRARVHYDADGTLVLTVRAPAEQGQVVLAALEQARAQLDAEAAATAANADPSAPAPAAPADVSAETSGPATPMPQPAPAGTSAPVVVDDADSTSTWGPPRATLGQALLRMAESTLQQDGATSAAAAGRRRRQLTIQVDPLSGWARTADGELLPPTSLRQVLLTLPGRARRPWGRLRPSTPADLTRHDLGRTARLPDRALRELLGTVDGERCRFPGCSRHRRLHAHHVRWWSEGGGTDLHNLVLLCGRHHTLVHGHGPGAGFLLTLSPDRTLDVTTADGGRLPHKPPLPWGDPLDLDPQQLIGPDQLTPGAVTRLDLSYAVGVVLQQAA